MAWYGGKMITYVYKDRFTNMEGKLSLMSIKIDLLRSVIIIWDSICSVC